MFKGWVALTGTPGVGKSSVADKLRLAGISIVELGRFAHDYDLVEGVDEKRMSSIVDPARVAPVLREVWQKDAPLLLVGHWAHEVPDITAALVLRLDPRHLKTRLERRGWPAPKVRENLEAEAIDLATQEAVHRLGASRVYELDATNRSVEETARQAYRVLKGPRSAGVKFKPGRVDWSKAFLEIV